MLPTVAVAEATGWPQGAAPTPARGLRVTAFARGLDHPRWLLVLPNGDVLVAETNKPPRRPGKGGGVGGFVTDMFMKKAGAGVPSANRITLLRDADGDGVAELSTPFLTGLVSPFGMALVGATLYVANADALVAFPYRQGATRIDGEGRKVADLPAGRNHHWTKSLTANADGSLLYVGVGSNSNVAEHGMDEEVNRAAILEIDPATGATRVFASGLRNPVGIKFNPQSGALWAAVNERDMLGNDVPPDYLTSVRPGGFYGWPWSYWGQNTDKRVEPARPDMVARAIKPDYGLGAHTAPLGLTFSNGARLRPALANGAFVGLHGSWNRKPRTGYKVVFIPFENGRPSGPPVDILTGFLSRDQKALGRPVGVEIARDGALLVADDVGNVVWRVSR
jgi:glucose/arabinose dehydrogenase